MHSTALITVNLVLFLVERGHCYNSVKRTFHRVLSFDNTLITDFTLSSSGSLTDCVSECAGNSQCVSFFYNRDTKSCSGHTVQFYSDEPVTADETSRYFTMDKDVRDCADIQMNDPSSQDGVYTINPQDGQGPFQVYCDMTTDGGGWTVFQKRIDGTGDFFRAWSEYKQGFGNISGNFWLGNDKIHRLTTARASQLRIDMLDESNAAGFAKYSTFSIDTEAEKYRLLVSGFSGDRGDSMTEWSSGQKFTTKDDDNDAATFNCAQRYYGGWWYDGCHHANLNGLYGSTLFGEGLNWRTWHGWYVSLKQTEMKVKPA